MPSVYVYNVKMCSTASHMDCLCAVFMGNIQSIIAKNKQAKDHNK